MECFKSVKVHPKANTLLPVEDSSDSESEDLAKCDVEGAVGGGTSPDGLNAFREQSFSWQDFIEEHNCEIEEQGGQKSSLYMLDGEPLMTNDALGSALHLITEEVIKTYGLEFLNVVADAVVDTFVDRKMNLATIMDGLQKLDFTKCCEPKVLIWIDDEPLTSNPNLSFGRCLLTELLCRNIEPQLVIPCNDMDEEVLYTIVETLTDEATPTEQDRATALEAVFKIGLSLALATPNSNLIIIDADRPFYDVQDFHNFMDFAQELGHQVLYLRNNPEITNKNLTVKEFADKVEKLYKPLSRSHNDAKLGDEIGNDLTCSSGTTSMDILDSTLAFFQASVQGPGEGGGTTHHGSMDDEASEQSDMEQLEERLKNTEIIHKLSQAHFTLPDPSPCEQQPLANSHTNLISNEALFP